MITVAFVVMRTVAMSAAWCGNIPKCGTSARRRNISGLESYQLRFSSLP